MSRKILTSNFGVPVADNQNSLTAGKGGPTLLQDAHLLEKHAHFNRERVPERVVHAKGAGAHGYFEVTHDVSKWTKAKFLGKIGKKTPMFARFSTVGGEKGSADSARDPRGFALKFYTEEGNYDLVGNNTPVFFIRDAMKFPDFIHTQKRNPVTNCKDPNAFWDFLSMSPESTHQVTILFSDRGIPQSYRHINGYGGHTFKWINVRGEGVWVKYHFKTEAGIKNWLNEDAAIMAGKNPDYATEDLFNHMAKGKKAIWKAYVQVMAQVDAASYRFNPFDVTKVWPHKDYPLIPFGQMVLDRNPENYFAEVEQAAFEPSNMVPGIEPSPDKMLQGRLFAYADAHRYRIGANYALLPINCPYATRAQNYQRDGAMRFGKNGGGSVNYEPNSMDGPKQASEYIQQAVEVMGTVAQTPYEVHAEDNDFVQPGNLYRLMRKDEKARLISNLAVHMKAVKSEIQLRQIRNFYRADIEYGTRLGRALGKTARLAA
ncbi:MAG: catalase [Elusimicrobiota bacterium]